MKNIHRPGLVKRNVYRLGFKRQEQRAGSASQWQLIWRKFRKHRLAKASGLIVILLYSIAILADFIAPYSPRDHNVAYTYSPPQPLRFFERTEGGLQFRPHVNGYSSERDPVTWSRVYRVDETETYPIGLFVRTESYKLLGLVTLNRRLIGPKEPGKPMYLLGADRMGRDVFSRVIHGSRISLSIGLVGVTVSLFLGIILGGISGYFGGRIDLVIQRAIELLQSIPTIPLWMGLAAAIPLTMPPVQVYFLITIIISLIGWTGLARQVRGKFYSLKTDDFITAARLDGSGELRIIMRHMVPSFMSHIIATVTLAIPAMILAETSLSFLGIGLRPPVVSWGVLLQEAQNIRAVSAAPWLLSPGLAVVVAVLALNFLGDGLRDAADPYSS